MPTTDGIEIPISADVSGLTTGMNNAKQVVSDFGSSAATSLSQAATSMDALNSRLAQYQKMEAFFQRKGMQQSLDQVRNSIQQTRAQMEVLNATQNNLIEGSQSSRNVMMAFNRVIKDSHSLLYSSTRGVAELSYALPYLFQRIGEVKQETGSWKGALTALSGSLFNWTGLLFAAGTAVAFYLRSHKEAKKEVDEHQKAVDGFEKKAAEEIVRFKELAIAVSDANKPMSERKGILHEMRSHYEPYLKNLSDEQILAGKLDAAYASLVNSMRAKVALQSLEDKLIPVIKQQLDLQVKNVELQKAVDAAANDKKYLTAQDLRRDGVRRLAAEQKAAGEKATKQIEDNKKAYEALEKTVKSLVGSMKPLIDEVRYDDEKEKKDKKERFHRDPKGMKRVTQRTVDSFNYWQRALDREGIAFEKHEKLIRGNSLAITDYSVKAQNAIMKALFDQQSFNHEMEAMGSVLVPQVAGAFQKMFEGIALGGGLAIGSLLSDIGKLINRLISAAAAAALLGLLLSATGIGGAIGMGDGFKSNFSSIFGMLSGFKIPGHAAGGITTGPHLAMVGEGKEREAIMPLSRLNEFVKNRGAAQVAPVPQLFMKGNDFWIMWQRNQRANLRNL